MKFLISSLFIVVLSFIFNPLNAQDTRSQDPDAIFQQSPSSREPESKKAEVKESKKRKKVSKRRSYNQQMDKKVEEFEERMEANAKKYKKRKKEMEKPQYSDPSYFGHKKKPKKRPPGKQKFCKECGIKH